LLQVDAGCGFEQLEPSDPPARDAMARMIARARAEAEQIHESARTEGFAAGHRDGRERGAAEIGSAASALGQAAHGIDALREGTAKAIEADAVELALALPIRRKLRLRGGRSKVVLKQAFAEGERDHVFGVPTLVVDGEPFWGNDRMEWVIKKLDKMGLRR